MVVHKFTMGNVSHIHMTMGSVSHIHEAKKDLVRDVHKLSKLGVRLVDSSDGCFMVHKISESSFVVEVKSKKHLDKSLMECKETVRGKTNENFSLGCSVILNFQKKLCFPKVDVLKH